MLLGVPAFALGPRQDQSPVQEYLDLRELLGRNLFIEGDVAHLYIETIDFKSLWADMNTIKLFKTNRLVIHLFSFGGSVFDALAMAALLREYEASGRIIEVRARGIVASAGLLILLSGTPGHRYLNPFSMVMFHELTQFKFFAVETPTDKEEEAAVLRRIQDAINTYICERSKIGMIELRDKIRKKEFWLTAQEAIRYGFADKLL
jgi:ATP-dependent protease ClpP protease subunit